MALLNNDHGPVVKPIQAAVERALNKSFPQTVFKVEVGDALDTLAVHWHGDPSQDAVNTVIARAGRMIGFQYTPSDAWRGG